MPIAVEVTSQAKFAEWIAQKGGHMPGAKPAAAAAPSGGGGTTTDTITPAPPTPGTAATPAPAPANPNVANRTNQ